MSVIFSTSTTIDLEAAFTFGMSVKETKSPIGFFGTGLKYAIATLLRTGHDIVAVIDGQTHAFSTEEKNHRGKEFKLVCLDGRSLGFTTELGKNWEVWMAFRELHSNTLDEGGETLSLTTDMHIKESGTHIVVDGSGIDKAFLEMGNIFIARNVLAENECVKVRQGGSCYVYYRGVRAMKLPHNSQFTYDIQKQQNLTEDRTFSFSWSALYDLGSGLMELDCIDTLRKVLTAPDGSFEHDINWEEPSVTPSTAFLQVVGESFHSEFLSNSARKVGHKHRVGTSSNLEFTQVQQKQLSKAIDFLKKLDFEVDRFPVKLVEMHGALAEARDGVIFLSPQLFRMGTKYVALGVLEEFIHLSEGVHDETRQMQTLLFETILTLGEKLTGEPI